MDYIRNEKPISNMIDYLFNKYITTRAIEIIEQSSYSESRKLCDYKIIKHS